MTSRLSRAELERQLTEFGLDTTGNHKLLADRLREARDARKRDADGEPKVRRRDLDVVQVSMLPSSEPIPTRDKSRAPVIIQAGLANHLPLFLPRRVRKFRAWQR